MELTKYTQAVEKHSESMRTAANWIWEHPETGYREWETSAYLEKIFEDAGYELTRAGNIPGFYTDIDTGRPGPKLLILSELDALYMPNHASSKNGCAHACGHHAQCAAMVGIALALKEPGMLDGLSGSIRLMLVPAEEGIEIAYRTQLRREGIIHYYTGKDEFLYRGYMDGVDLAYMFHTSSRKDAMFDLGVGQNGLIQKVVRYQGTASHAGGSPHLGNNALYAATIGLQAINALRETFKDDDHIRVHPIITAGGDSVNIIPSHVQIESYVRGASLDCICESNRKVNRALAAGALALGTTVHVTEAVCYAPLLNSPELSKVAQDCMGALLGAEHLDMKMPWGCGSTDMGNLSCVMPVIHPHISGASGKGHGDDYRITDFETACVRSAQGQLLIAAELLKDDAARAREVKAAYRPLYASKDAYFSAMDALDIDKELVIYDEQGAHINY